MLRPTAEAIWIDGYHDWGAIPFVDDPAGDAGADPGVDITSVALAPIADALLFAFTTAGPAPFDATFVVALDFARGARPDVEIDVVARAGGVFSTRIFDDAGQLVSTSSVTGFLYSGPDSGGLFHGGQHADQT